MKCISYIHTSKIHVKSIHVVRKIDLKTYLFISEQEDTGKRKRKKSQEFKRLVGKTHSEGNGEMTKENGGKRSQPKKGEE